MADLREHILLANPHWEVGFIYPYQKERTILNEVQDSLKNNLIIAISGLRRVGKSVILKQCINYLIKSGMPRRNVLYLNLDDVAIEDFISVINAWQAHVPQKIYGNTFCLLVDEVQKVTNWGEKIKSIYDNLNIKILLSGSASLQIKKGNESLAGRITEKIIAPLSFKEFLDFSNRSSDVKSVKQSYYDIYLFRQLPELAINDSLSSKEYIESIVKKALWEDCKNYLNIENSEILESIFSVICKSPGEIIDYEDVAKDFRISRNTSAQYFKALVDCFLVRKLYNYSRNARKSEKKSKKFYPYFTTLHEFVRPYPVDYSKIAETEVAWQTKAGFFYNDQGQEIDFICGDELNKGIEVKMRNKVDDSDLKILIKNKLNLKTLYVIIAKQSIANISDKNITVVRFHELNNYF